MESYLQSYLKTALWSSIDDDGSPMDDTYGEDDISDELKESSLKDLTLFIKEAGSLLDGLEPSQVAHDFWLTRNNHGAGFWDGDYEKKIGEKLTKLSHKFGEVHLYVGDDGKIYSQ